VNPHEHAYELVPLYTLGALDAAEREAVAAHLHACLTCQEELAVHAAVAAALTADAPAPQHVWRRIEQALDRG
jgi:anti-sigma factor ChrR (cupin superfamily)